MAGMVMGIFTGVVIGILLGIAVGLAIVMTGIRNSNDLGDSKASFRDFSAQASVQILAKKDKVSKKKYLEIVHMERPM